MVDKDKQLQHHIEALEREGYVIKKKTLKTKTHTFIIDIELLKAFQACAAQRKVTIRQALNEAITAWIKR